MQAAMGWLNFASQVPIGLSSVSKNAPLAASRVLFGASAALLHIRGSGSLHASHNSISVVGSLTEDRFGSFYAAGSMPVATQAPAVAQKAAEADVMGLLLQQRIVFLGCTLDDFAADAIISQLLLLDAQDSNKDIRLFINSSGGSMRYSY
ncbi:hypothetical protein L7F22_037611 [Adiantum nelumboides]|nr:hypothetical protein [Adiantum nelumboides]